MKTSKLIFGLLHYIMKHSTSALHSDVTIIIISYETAVAQALWNAEGFVAPLSQRSADIVYIMKICLTLTFSLLAGQFCFNR